MASDNPVDHLLMLNGRPPSAATPGERLKIVTLAGGAKSNFVSTVR
jgi:hypothetical protein